MRERLEVGIAGMTGATLEPASQSVHGVREDAAVLRACSSAFASGHPSDACQLNKLVDDWNAIAVAGQARPQSGLIGGPVK
jgi:uncharacterized protein YllA (UPF0747 family)